MPPFHESYAEEAGEAILHIEVDENDHFVKAEVVKSSGYRNLDRFGVRAIAQCKYLSGVFQGKKIKSAFNLIYGWKFSDEVDTDEIVYVK